jgi:hypothetical protein
MKNMLKYRKLAQSIMVVLAVCYGFVACDDNPDKFEPTKGVPEVLYVRIPDVASADSLLDGAFLDNTICLVGNNLRSVHEIYFNDQKAVLNTSYITDHTLIVAVPKGIPTDVTDKIYLITADNQTVAYPSGDGKFVAKVPAPVVNTISCEYVADGNEAVLYGDYFIDDANIPLEISMAGNVLVKKFISIEKTAVRFVVPEGAQKGFINVTSLYGTGRSHFQFRDDRGMIIDWDELKAGGWRNGNLAGEDGISGNYVVFQGNLDNGDWNEDGFSFNLWGPSGGRPDADLIDTSDPLFKDNLQMKFEINIRGAWSADAMQLVFSPWNTVDNAFYSDSKIGRALWIPWATTGSYETDGWITVAVPIANFKYTHEGATASVPDAGGYGSLSFFVWNGGVSGSACSPEMWIDNIRVVPIE